MTTMPVPKLILSAFFSIATGFGAPELPQAVVRTVNTIIPESTAVRAEDYGLRAHTNHLVLAPEAAKSLPKAAEAEPDATTTAFKPAGFSPAGIRSVYKLPATGGAGVIAIVDAYDDPAAEQDLGTFSAQFGLPQCTSANGCFHKVYASGRQPAANCSWAQEADLDIEWAHAMAPDAKIMLVEAASNGSTDLMKAVDVASSIVNPNGREFGEVSMSWGFGEFSGETSFDKHFQHSGVVYVASTGDVGGARDYPAVSPYVVAVGGTSLHLNSAGQVTSETAWSGSGGGPSGYEERPSYQNSIVKLVAGRRGAPDVSFDADPDSGVAIYDSTPCQSLKGWLVFGGTSVSAPSTAGVINLSGHFYASSGLELGVIYSHLGSADYRDITQGKAGSFTAKPGWDFVTGSGSSLGLAGK